MEVDQKDGHEGVVNDQPTADIAGVSHDTTAKDPAPATEATQNDTDHGSKHPEWELNSSPCGSSCANTSELGPISHHAASNYIKNFPKSSFFKQRRASDLPLPADIRAINEGSGDIRATSFDCPPPVMIPSLGLLVKYGAGVTIREAQTQIMLREQLQGCLPIPEVFGWTEDGDQTFVYMSLLKVRP